MICGCEYDLINCVYNNVILSNDTCVYLYNLITTKSNIYKEVEVEYPYIYACDEEYQYIIHQDLEKIIYKKKYTEYTQAWYEFCGNTEKGLGIIDSLGNTVLDNNYDEITIELTVSGINKNSKTKKIIKFPNSVFKKHTISDISKW